MANKERAAAWWICVSAAVFIVAFVVMAYALKPGGADKQMQAAPLSMPLHLFIDLTTTSL